MSTPIGSIEFLVKFDTMSDSFKDALKEALEDADMDFGDADSLKEIKEAVEYIRWNVRTRLRTPFTGDYRQARVAAPGQYNWLLEEGTINELAQKLINWKGGVPVIPQKEGEDDEDYTKRVEHAAKVILQQYGGKLLKILDPKSGYGYFMNDPKGFIHIQNMLNEAISGTWSNLIKDTIQKLFPESMVKKVSAGLLRSSGATVYEGEKQWSDVTKEFGLGTTPLAGPGDVETMMQDLDVLPAVLEEIYSLDPKDFPKASDELKQFAKDIYEGYSIKVNAQLPNIVLLLIKYWAEQARSEAPTEAEKDAIDIGKFWGRTGKRPDIFGWLLEENKEKFYKMIRQRLKPDDAETFIAKMEAVFEDSEIFVILEELKTYFTASKAQREIKLGRLRESLRASFFAGEDVPMGMTIIDLVNEKVLPKIEEVTGEKEQMVEDTKIAFDQIIRMLAMVPDIPEETTKKIIEQVEDAKSTFGDYSI